ADLGHGSDGRSTRLNGVALFNRDGRRNGFDPVDLRLVHPVEELARVRGKGFDITTLALGKKGIEGQRAFARAAGPCDDEQAMQRQIEIEILEIVMSHATQTNRWNGRLF